MAGILSGNVLGAAPGGVGFLPLPLPLTLAPLISHYTGRAASSAADTATTAAQRVQEEIPVSVEDKPDEEGVWGSDKALLIGLAVVGGLIFWKAYSDKKKAKAKVRDNRRRRRLRRNAIAGPPGSKDYAAYKKVRDEAQRLANETGFDYGVEKLGNPPLGGWRYFMLPEKRNRTGHELRCEVVMCESDARMRKGHGYKNNRGRPRRNTRTEQVPAWQAIRTEQMPMHKGQVLIGAPLQQKRDDYKHEGMEAAEASIQAGHGASAKARDTTWARRVKSIRSSLLTPRTTQLLEQSWKQGWNLRARAAGYVANRRRPRRTQ
jgi:hypothetical protein